MPIKRVVTKIHEPTISEMWRCYRVNVLEPSGIRDPLSNQFIETRRTFYSGCMAMLSLVAQIPQQDGMTEEEACEVLEGMEREGRSFFAKVGRDEPGY